MNQKSIILINGPNLNLLGLREPAIYGSENWLNIEERLRQSLKAEREWPVELEVYQSNHEGMIIDFIQSRLATADAAVINPAAYTKTGFGILDALTVKPLPYVEIHLSNIFARGSWHAESIFTNNSCGFICGFGGYGYDLALKAIINYLRLRER